jgi:hypothetical protein
MRHASGAELAAMMADDAGAPSPPTYRSWWTPRAARSARSAARPCQSALALPGRRSSDLGFAAPTRVLPRGTPASERPPELRSGARDRAGAVEDPARVKTLLADLVRVYEGGAPAAWSFESLPADYVAGMQRGIVAFEIPIEGLEGKAKLSQNRDAVDQGRTREALAAADDPLARRWRRHGGAPPRDPPLPRYRLASALARRLRASAPCAPWWPPRQVVVDDRSAPRSRAQDAALIPPWRAARCP